MSSGYALHLEAYADLDDIRYYIARENPDAADRVISEIFDILRGLVAFPHQGHRAGPHLAPLAVHSRARILDCLCPRGKSLVGCRGHARAPKSPPHGRHPERQGVNTARASAVWSLRHFELRTEEQWRLASS